MLLPWPTAARIVMTSNYRVSYSQQDIEENLPHSRGARQLRRKLSRNRLFIPSSAIRALGLLG